MDASAKGNGTGSCRQVAAGFGKHASGRIGGSRGAGAVGRLDTGPRECRSRVSFGVRRRGGPAASPSSPRFLSRFARATAAIALTALVMSGATLGLVTPVHAASDGDLRIEDGPLPATGPSASNPTATTVRLAWTLPSQPAEVTVSAVEVQWRSGASWSTIATLAAVAESLTVTGLDAGTDYNFRIRLVTSGGNADSDAVSATTLGPPKAATDLVATHITRTTLDLYWTLPTQLAGVRVTRVAVIQLMPRHKTVAKLAADATSYTVTGLTADTSYSFHVQLVTNNGYVDTVPVTVTTLPDAKPPVALTASNATTTTIDLAWRLPTQSSGVRVGDLHVQQQSGTRWKTVARLAGQPTAHTVTGLTADTAYSFRIMLLTSAGQTNTLPVSASTLAANALVANAATGLAASNVTKNSVDLAWTLPSQPEGVSVTRVEVEHRALSGEIVDRYPAWRSRWYSPASLPADATSHTVSQLWSGTTYQFRIRLVTSHGDAETLVSASTAPVPRYAMLIRPSNVTETTADLAWILPTQPSGVTVTAVVVQRQLWSDNDIGYVKPPWTTVARLGANATSYNVTGLTRSTRYAFRIRLETSHGNQDSFSQFVTTLTPAKPAIGLTVSNVAETTADLAWALPGQPAGVTVSAVVVQKTLWQKWPRSWTTVASLAATATSHEVTGLTGGEGYRFRIRLVTNRGNAETVTVATTRTLTNANPVTDLTVSNVQARTADLSWTLPTQPSGVTVTRVEIQQVSKSGEGRADTLAKLPADATRYTMAGMTSGHTYHARVRLVTSRGNADSERVSVTAGGDLNPVSGATGLMASKVTGATVALAWTLPAQSSDVTVTGVEVQQSSDADWATVATLAADATSHTVTGLSAGQRYRFRIRIVATGGSATTQPVPVSTLEAEAATGLTASNATLTTVDLSWTLPAQPRGVTVREMRIERRVWVEGRLSSDWRSVATLAADATSYTVTGRTPRTEYSFRIRTVTTRGGRVYSDPVYATTSSTGLTVSNVAGTTVDLAWTAPHSSESVTGVAVEYRRSSSRSWWSTAASLAADATSHTVTGLTGETAYSFRVRFLTTDGSVDSESVSATTLVGPVRVPGLGASMGTEAMTLSWRVPEQPEGVTVTGVKVLQEVESAWTTVATLAADATSYRVTGLTPATTYRFIIRIASDQGNADAGEFSLTTMLDLAATPGDGEVTLTWSDATNARGHFDLPIDSWEVRRKEADAAAWGAWAEIAGATAETVSHTVTGLENGTRYAFQVRAKASRRTPLTSSGTVEAEPASATSTANAATGLAASNPTQTSVDLAWTLPEQPEGVSVSGVEVQQQAADETWTTVASLAADATTHTVTGLTAATSYTFRVRLTTSNGDADSDSVSTSTLAAPPAATGLNSPTQGVSSILLMWTLPTQPTDVTVTGVEVQQQAADETWSTVATLASDATSHTVTELTAGTSYTFRIRLVTSSGSADSEPVDAQTAHTPLEVKMTGSVPDAGGGGSGQSGSPGDGCAAEVSVEFLDADGNAVAVDSLAASDFMVENGRSGTPVADADGLGWTVPVRTTDERGFVRVRLPATERWEAAAQVFHNRGAGVCAPAARWELADLRLYDLSISPSFTNTGTSYTSETADPDAEVVAEAVYADAVVTIAPGDADEDTDGHQVALAEGETEVTVTVTPGDGSAANTYTVTVTREAVVNVLTGFVLVDASTDADLGAVTGGATVTVAAGGSYGIRAEVEADAEVGSVVLMLRGPGASGEERKRTENVAPYSLFGDAEGAEHGRSLTAGSYLLTATAYEHSHGAGKALGTLRAPFTVAVEAGTNVLTGFTLVDASDQSTLAALTDGATVDLSGNFGTSFAIRADVAPAVTVGSVTLTLEGAKTKGALENLAPYSLYGDRDDGAGGRALDGSSLPAGSYTLRAKAYTGARASGAVLGTRSVSFEVLRPPALTVVNAHAREGINAHLPFGVWLDRESTTAVTVDYTTVDGTATAGSDYTATSGTLTFAAGETRKTVLVPVLDDDIDEGSETLTLRLSNPQGAIVAKGEGIGTITNDDPIPEAWLARFGRTVTGQVLDAVEARLAAPRVAGAEASLAGQALPSWRGGDGASPGTVSGAGEEDRAALAAMTAWLAQTGSDGRGTTGFGAHGGDGGLEPQSHALTQRDLIAGTSFALTGGSSEGGGFASLWGRGSIAGFDGREGSLTVDGEVTTGLVGADWASERWTAGLALGHSTGTGGWRKGGTCDLNCGGAIEATLSGVYPYAGLSLTERLSVWAAAGHGSGEVTVTPEASEGGSGTGMTADLTLSMGAAGVRSEVLRAESGDGLVLALKGDARFTRTSSDAVRSEGGNLEAADADVWLVRAGVEGSRRFALGPQDEGASVTPSFELGLRRDGGDAETGFGADLGGGLAFADPANGLVFESRARALVAHEADGFREWGASLAGSWDPSPETDRGLSVSLTQSWGASPSGGMDALLGRETLAGLAPVDGEDGSDGFHASRRLEGELGYGLGVFGGAFTGTPNVGLGLSETARDWRIGWRLAPAGAGAAGFEMSLDATRSEPANDDARPEHGVMLRGALRW